MDRLGMAAHWFRWSLAPGALRQGPNVVEVELLKAEPTATFERACVARTHLSLFVSCDDRWRLVV